MKKITISDILKQYDHYRALAQMKPYGTAVKTFVNSVLKSSVEEPYLTQEIVDKWFERREKECENTHYTRTSHLKNFLQFAIDKGLTDVVIPTISSKWTPHFKSPVLMTEEEIIKFFKACDECPVNIESTGAYIDAITKRTIFRLLYSTGMRPNEARLLSVNDIDLNTGVVSIRETKGYHQHINVLCDSMLNVMKEYDNVISKLNPNREFFFQQFGKSYYSSAWLASAFSNFWHKYNTSNAVVYGFRHHYAIVNINSWIDLGFEESTARLMTLSKSMGHSKLKHTLYYYSLVPQYAVTMEELSEKGLDAIIRKLPDYEEI